MDAQQINALIGSRICHDLISPLGAIGNGVELLTMSGLNDAPEMALISESVDNANARIRFFRIAFGAANPGSMIGNAELKSVIAAQYRGNRLKIDWRLQDDVPRADAKLAFLLLQCLESTLPWGGKVQVTRTSGTWNFFGNAERLKIDTPLWKLITTPGTEAEINASNVHFALVHDLAAQFGKSVTVNFAETSISVSF